jgi:hypothetical protein
MITIPASPTREEALRFIAIASIYGNLGLFIGAGFSKAVLNDDDAIALSWGELLDKAATKMGVDYNSVIETGRSFPEIASTICKKHSQSQHISFTESLRTLKEAITSLTSWYPTQKQQEVNGQYLENFAPAWIITTNYDLVIESLLTGNSIALGPNDPLSAPRGVVPVFHLHGLRTNPEHIIIAQEDYVTLFRPSQYRQMKLALTIKESTTLVIGYGLGDVNVLTALDWSTNVFEGGQPTYPRDVIQVLRAASPVSQPYRTDSGILVLETDELSNFFKEFAMIRTIVLQEEDGRKSRLDALKQRLTSAHAPTIAKFIDDAAFRSQMLKVLSESSLQLISAFVSFLDKCIDETWERSKPDGAFEAYNQQLIVVLDILGAFSLDKFPPALFQKTAYSLQRVGNYVGDAVGKSYAASATWKARSTDLSPEIINELSHLAKQYNYYNVETLIEPLLKGIS